MFDIRHRYCTDLQYLRSKLDIEAADNIICCKSVTRNVSLQKASAVSNFWPCARIRFSQIKQSHS